MRYMNGWLGVGGRGQRAGARARARGRARAILGKGQSQLTYLTYNPVSEENKDEKKKKFCGRTKVEPFFQVPYL